MVFLLLLLFGAFAYPSGKRTDLRVHGQSAHTVGRKLFTSPSRLEKECIVHAECMLYVGSYSMVKAAAAHTALLVRIR